MAGITLEQAQAQLDLYLAAEAACLGGQSYKINGRELTRADLDVIRSGVAEWNARVVSLAGSAQGRGRSRVIVPCG